LTALIERLGLRTLCVAALLATSGRVADAATIRVPADFPTIQAAIDAAGGGDTVLVAPGTYVEQIDFRGKLITVASEDGPEFTTIDASGAGPVVTFRSGESRASMLSGFTITGGYSIYGGAGVLVSGSSPTLRGNIIAGNRGCTGVGVYSYFSSPRIEQNVVSNNIVDGCSGAWGIGIYIGGDTTAEIIGNRITANAGSDATGAGVALFAAGRATLVGNVIDQNSTRANGGCGWGGGLAIANFAEHKIINNVITRNTACTGGAVYWLGTGSGNGSVLVNNTIADNVAVSYPGVYASGVGAANRFFNNVISSATGPVLFCQATSWATAPSLDSNDVFSTALNPYGGSCTDQTGILGNISANPGFDDPQSGDYSIGFESPLVDAGNNAAPFLPATDVAGSPRIASAGGAPDRIDIGAYEFFNVNQAPIANAGDDQVVAADSGCVAAVTLSGSGSDPDGDPLTFVWSGAFGSGSGATVTVSLPVGTHVVTLTVSDGKGGVSADSVTITVRDTTPPTIQAIAANPSVINRTNHDMVSVAISVSATDACGGAVTCRIVSVTSNEPVSGTGGGDLSPDWQITGPLTLLLRAERSPKGSGRVYTITVECSDASGNPSTRTTTVTVPRK
jgi:Big-like domain-containing protein/copper-binding protein NosD